MGLQQRSIDIVLVIGVAFHSSNEAFTLTNKAARTMNGLCSKLK
jgi:hypothetical protein